MTVNTYPNLRGIYHHAQLVYVVVKREGLPVIEESLVKHVSSTHVKLTGHKPWLPADQLSIYDGHAGIYCNAAPHIVHTSRENALVQARNMLFEAMLELAEKKLALVKLAMEMTKEIKTLTGGDARVSDVDQGMFNAVIA